MSTTETLRDYLGYRAHTTARSTGTVVLLLNAEEADLDTDGGIWATVCEEHHNLMNHETRALARSWMSSPEQWCEDCGVVYETLQRMQGRHRVRVSVRLVVEVDPLAWAESYGPTDGEVIADVRRYALGMLQGSPAAEEGAIVSVSLV